MEAWKKAALEAAVLPGNEHPTPYWISGVPRCSETCPHHDGKRCSLLGLRPNDTCEPVAVEVSRMLAESKDVLAKLDQHWLAKFAEETARADRYRASNALLEADVKAAHAALRDREEKEISALQLLDEAGGLLRRMVEARRAAVVDGRVFDEARDFLAAHWSGR